LIEELSRVGYDVIPFAMKHARNLPSAYSDFFVDEVDYHAPQPWQTKIRTAARMLVLAPCRLEARGPHRCAPPGSRAPAQHLSSTVSGHPPIARRAQGFLSWMTLHDLKLACPNYKMRTDGKICETVYHWGLPSRGAAPLHPGIGRRERVVRNRALLHRSSGVYENNVDRFIVPSRFYLQKMIEAGLPASKLCGFELHPGRSIYAVVRRRRLLRLRRTPLRGEGNPDADRGGAGLRTKACC